MELSSRRVHVAGITPNPDSVFMLQIARNPTDMVEDGDYRWGTEWRYGFGPVEWVQKYWRKYSDAA